MITVSIIVLTHNAQDVVVRCLDSVINQTFGSLDIVVVDDASSDGTVSIIESYRTKDSRIRLVQHSENKGTLVSRCEGIAASRGDYITFLDQDDELVLTAIEDATSFFNENPSDIVHFGVEVIAENSLAQDAAEGMSTFMNPPAPRTLEGKCILEHGFQGIPNGFDWNVCHKLIRGDLARDIEPLLKKERLLKAEDAYCMFAIEACARSYAAIPCSRWYRYHVGEGATLSGFYSLEKVKDLSDQHLRSYHFSQEFATEFLETHPENREVVHFALDSLGVVLCENAVNEILDHTKEEDRLEAMRFIEATWPERFVKREYYRIIRDREYARFNKTSSLPESLADVTTSISTDFVDEKLLEAELLPRPFAQAEKEALRNLRISSERSRLLETWKQQRIRIFVATHKDATLFNSEILQPVQVGTASTGARLPFSLRDGDGDNISDLNPYYCELTAQYLAWKNLDAEYYGLCHYRRYFSFIKDQVFEENPWGEVESPTIDDAAAVQYGMDDETISACIEGYDVVLPVAHDVREFPENYLSNRDQYARAPFLKVEDLDGIMEIVKRNHPDYATDVDDYLNDSLSYFCNMFIMKKQIFRDYCSWLFPLLEEFCDTWDTTKLGIQSLRTPGHLAERLLNVYVRHQMRTGSNWSLLYLQSIHFLNTDKYYPIEKIEPRVSDSGPVVPIVLAASNNYVPMLATTIQSVAVNARKDRTIDIVVLTQDIEWRYREQLVKEVSSNFDNIVIRFVSIGHLVSKYELTTNNPHISSDTFLRFLIPEILPFYEKAIYLDCDLIVEADIVDFFDIDLGVNILGATHDVDYLGNLNEDDGIRMQYSKNVLKMKDPYAYFQAGVLLLNLNQMSELHTTEDWMNLAVNSEYIYNDQDILNAECEGRVEFVDARWNVTTDIFNRVNAIYTRAPKKYYEEYLESRKNPKIVHYAGAIKPWSSPSSDLAELYWRYARTIPFYEMQIGSIVMKNVENANKNEIEIEIEDEIEEQPEPSKAKRAILTTANVMAPRGSSRRELGWLLLRMMGRR